MKTSFKIGTLMGIPILIHISFLIVLFLFAFVFSSVPEPVGFADVQPAILGYGLSLMLTILLFTCVLLHELGHSYFAKKYGVEINNITLFLIGGVSSMEEMPREPAQEAKMAFAGPFVSFLIGGILFGLNLVIDMMVAGYSTTIPYRLVYILASINIVLGAFNLIPAFPMDGGRILRAFFARHMNYIQATRNAANVGKFFAFLLALLGILSNPWNPWLLLIAVFVYMGASGEERSTAVTRTLENVKVKDVMSSDVISVSPEMNLEELVQFMFDHKHMGYPVIQHNVLKGIVTFTDVHKVTQLDRISTLVSDVMTRDVVTISPGDNAAEAFKVLNNNNVGRLVVMEDGEIIGILSRTDLMHTMTLLSE
ncbi:CBS domain-containing protein [Methanohalophilus mahii]|uniref:Zinc metalloprotease n=1 Tax=Methanohalophilus mahii (strain ATCC 35705 / DSM 5219 / SLP) TaxID=547558 RepID=D5E8Z3_METMS|nr:CBS domain-containing protein [Methanohalophilus mahii]ADE37524.1 peptidase M50 [Methanohalophilus mahii DSM 5219]